MADRSLPSGIVILSLYPITKRLGGKWLKAPAAYFELRRLGPIIVKGLSAPIEAYEVLLLGPLRTHFHLESA
jgi:hypothetical protein